MMSIGWKFCATKGYLLVDKLTFSIVRGNYSDEEMHLRKIVLPVGRMPSLRIVLRVFLPFFVGILIVFGVLHGG